MQHPNKKLKDYKRLHHLYYNGAVFTAFDTETTGISPTNARIMEIGAVTFNKDGIISTWSQLINPQMPVPPMITQLTHIDDSMLLDKPIINQVLPYFREFYGDNIFIAHNAQFDMNFLNAELEKCRVPVSKNKVIDTLQYSCFTLPDLERHKLDYLADYFKIDKGTSHRALDDALTCMNLFIKLCEINKEKTLN